MGVVSAARSQCGRESPRPRQCRWGGARRGHGPGAWTHPARPLAHENWPAKHGRHSCGGFMAATDMTPVASTDAGPWLR